MKYCTRCIIPDSRPNIQLDSSGVCNACRAYQHRSSIDWPGRARLFADVAARARSRSAEYDCLIPVSGGKDSHWQVITCLEHGLRPLTVTWRPPARTAIGEQNLRNLIALGVDHMDCSINPDVERRFMKRAFTELGVPALPMHMAMFNITLRLAVRLRIPLVVWGENSAFEYGSKDQAHEGFALDNQWVRTYGITHNTTAEDWIGEGLDRKDLAAYFGPSDEEIAAANVLAVFLGYYFPWDPITSLRAAEARGFQSATGPRTGIYNYADIDDDFISVHHYLKWYKFGFTRTYDNLSIEIRNGRLTRQAAIDRLKALGDETPHKDLAQFSDFIGISIGDFHEVAEKFRNLGVWSRRDDKWVIDDFLIQDWRWH